MEFTILYAPYVARTIVLGFCGVGFHAGIADVPTIVAHVAIHLGYDGAEFVHLWPWALANWHCVLVSEHNVPPKMILLRLCLVFLFPFAGIAAPL
jgi:hypothetical protein